MIVTWQAALVSENSTFLNISGCFVSSAQKQCSEHGLGSHGGCDAGFDVNFKH